MTKGRRSYSYPERYGFLSHLSFLYPLISLRLTSLLGWRVAVSVSISPDWLARCRQMHHRCRQPSLAGALPSDASLLPSALRQPLLAGALPSDALSLPSALPSALIGWRVAVIVAVSAHWLARCRQMCHRCRQRSLAGALPVRCVTVAVSVAVSPDWLARCRQMRHRCRQRCLPRSLAGALPSDASPLPAVLTG